MEKIHKWEFVELSALLEDSRTLPAALTLNLAGSGFPQRASNVRRKAISQILFPGSKHTPGTYVAVLMTCEANTN